MAYIQQRRVYGVGAIGLGTLEFAGPGRPGLHHVAP